MADNTKTFKSPPLPGHSIFSFFNKEITPNQSIAGVVGVFVLLAGAVGGISISKWEESEKTWASGVGRVVQSFSDMRVFGSILTWLCTIAVLGCMGRLYKGQKFQDNTSWFNISCAGWFYISCAVLPYLWFGTYWAWKDSKKVTEKCESASATVTGDSLISPFSKGKGTFGVLTLISLLIGFGVVKFLPRLQKVSPTR